MSAISEVMVSRNIRDRPSPNKKGTPNCTTEKAKISSSASDCCIIAGHIALQSAYLLLSPCVSVLTLIVLPSKKEETFT